eukprot:428460-Pleurochrysis_carterae.AAC.1
MPTPPPHPALRRCRARPPRSRPANHPPNRLPPLAPSQSPPQPLAPSHPSSPSQLPSQPIRQQAARRQLCYTPLLRGDHRIPFHLPRPSAPASANPSRQHHASWPLESVHARPLLPDRRRRRPPLLTPTAPSRPPRR